MPPLHRLELRGQLGELLFEPPRAILRQCRKLGLDLGDPPGAGVERRRLTLGGQQRLHLDLPARRGIRRRTPDVARTLEPHPDPLEGRARGVDARRQRLAQARLRSESLLGGRAPRGHRSELALGLVARGTRGSRRLLRRRELPRGRAKCVARQLEPRLERLPLDPRVQLRRLRLALQRPQPRSRLALDVQGTREVVLRALELQLSAPAPLAVLPEPGRLLDQEATVARLRVDDRLDSSLRHDRVHLLAEPGVGQRVDHVDEAAARSVQAVLALAVAVQPPHDRDLRELGRQPAVAVVDHDLDLGGRARRKPVAAGEDHVLHRLAAHRQGRLLAERPQHRVRHIRLARPVRADDHRHAGGEVELRPVGEGLEALQADRTQVHQ